VEVWFADFKIERVEIDWTGHDQPRSLGPVETGAAAALPIWMAYMEKALKGMPETPLVVPAGVVSLRINPSNGLRESDTQPGLTEFFYQEYVPRESPDAIPGPANSIRATSQDVRNQLF